MASPRGAPFSGFTLLAQLGGLAQPITQLMRLDPRTVILLFGSVPAAVYVSVLKVLHFGSCQTVAARPAGKRTTESDNCSVCIMIIYDCPQGATHEIAIVDLIDVHALNREAHISDCRCNFTEV